MVIAATTPIIPSVINTSANVKAILRELFQWATCVAPSANVKAVLLSEK